MSSASDAMARQIRKLSDLAVTELLDNPSAEVRDAAMEVAHARAEHYALDAELRELTQEVSP